MNYFLNFLSFADTQQGVQNPTAAEFIAGKQNVVFRGLSGNVNGVLSPNQKMNGEITRFLLKPVYNYNSTPATRTDEEKLYASIKLTSGKTVAVSLRQDQLDLKVGQTVTVQAGTEVNELNGRNFLGAEIL